MQIPTDALAWSRRHHGLVSLSAWTDAGGSRSSYFRARADGLLVPVAPNVAALVGTEVATAQRIAGGVLAFGPGVVAAHRSAAWLWGAPVSGDSPVELLTTRPQQRTTKDGYVIRRCRDGAAVRSVVRNRIPATTPLRTLVDLGASAPSAVTPTLVHFLRAAHVTLPSVRATLERQRRCGRRGVTALADALHDLAERGAVTDSELEDVMRALFRSAALDGWVFHELVAGYEVDFCFRRERMVVEVDGWAFHGAERERWERDRERDLDLTARGWVVVRLTWRMVTRRPAAAVARLRAALDLRGSWADGGSLAIQSHR